MSAVAREGFAGSGAIGRYWQTRCCGFEVRSVRGRRLGEVEELELDRKTRAAVFLLVGRRRRKPLRLRPDCVRVVDPWRQLLVVELPRRKPVVAPAARVLGRGVRRSVARTVPPAGRCVTRGARASGARTVALGRGARRAVPRVVSRAQTISSTVPRVAARGARTISSTAPRVTSRVARIVSWATPRVLFVAGLVAWVYAVIVFTLVRIALLVLAVLTVGTARGGARLKPHLPGRLARI